MLKILYELKDKKYFTNTFNTKDSGSVYASWYWSSTENRNDPDYVWIVRFTDGYGGWNHNNVLRLSSRLVRVGLII
jgi:hypothetical protein